MTITGRAKTVRRNKLDKQTTRLPIDAYHEMWIDPEGDGDGLFCVYVAELPDELGLNKPVAKDRFHSIDVPVSVDGVFFKVRSYVDFGNNVSHAPVIVAKNIRLSAAVKSSNGNRWGTNSSGAAIFFSVIGILSIGLAIVIFRSARTGSRVVRGATAERMMKSLAELGDDEEIKSASDRVAELAQQNSESNVEEEAE